VLERLSAETPSQAKRASGRAFPAGLPTIELPRELDRLGFSALAQPIGYFPDALGDIGFVGRRVGRLLFDLAQGHVQAR
jgi:hypothetical protein